MATMTQPPPPFLARPLRCKQTHPGQLRIASQTSHFTLSDWSENDCCRYDVHSQTFVLEEPARTYARERTIFKQQCSFPRTRDEHASP